MTTNPTGSEDARASGTFAGGTYDSDTYAETSSGSYATGATGATGATAPSSSGASEDRSLGDIVGDITKDFSTLMHKELELAKTEAKQEAKKAGMGAGMFAGAAVFGLVMLFALTWFLIQLLDNWMNESLAALTVTVLWGIVAAVLALQGKKKLQQTNPALPTTQQTLKEDVQWAKDQKNS